MLTHALTRCLRIAFSSASRSIPHFGCVGISIAFIPSESIICKTAKYVGLSMAITSPGRATGTQSEIQGFHAAACNDDFVRRKIAAIENGAAGNLAAQHLRPHCEVVPAAMCRIVTRNSLNY